VRREIRTATEPPQVNNSAHSGFLRNSSKIFRPCSFQLLKGAVISHRMYQVKCSVDTVEGGGQCFLLKNITLYYIDMTADSLFQELRPAGKASNRVTMLTENPDEPSANIAGSSGNEGQPSLFFTSG